MNKMEVLKRFDNIITVGELTAILEQFDCSSRVMLADYSAGPRDGECRIYKIEKVTEELTGREIIVFAYDE